MITRIEDGWVVLYREEGGPVAYIVPVEGVDSDGIPLIPTLDSDQALYRRMDEPTPNYADMRVENAAMMSRWRAEHVLKDEGYTLQSEDGFHNETGVQFWWHSDRLELRQDGVSKDVYRRVFKAVKPENMRRLRAALKLGTADTP